jgi:subfamily B ATP-binding cassette protein MsbA
MSYFRPDLGLIVLLLILIALSIVLSLMQSWPLAIIIDVVLSDQPKNSWIYNLFLCLLPHNRPAQVVGLALIGMFMKIAQDALTWIKVILNNRINNWGVMRLRNDLYAKLGGRADGDAMYRLVNDAQGPQVILSVLIGAAVSGLTFVLTAAFMFSRNVPLTLFALTVTPALIWINYVFGHAIQRGTTRAKEYETHMVSSLAAQPPPAHFAGNSLHVAGAWLDLNRVQEVYWFSVRTVFSLAGAVVFGYGGYLIWRDHFQHPVPDGMTVGTLVVFMDYLGKLWDPLRSLTGAAADIQPGAAGAKRVFEVLDAAAQANTTIG